MKDKLWSFLNFLSVIEGFFVFFVLFLGGLEFGEGCFTIKSAWKQYSPNSLTLSIHRPWCSQNRPTQRLWCHKPWTVNSSSIPCWDKSWSSNTGQQTPSLAQGSCPLPPRANNPTSSSLMTLIWLPATQREVRLIFMGNFEIM